MNNVDRQHSELIQKILKEGKYRKDRTGVGTKGIFGHQMRFKMSEGFPLLTLRKIHLKSVVHELLWFLSSYDSKYKKFGNTNVRYLLENGVTFWTDWVYEEYRIQTLKKWSDNDLKDDKTVKKLNLLSIKDFEKRIVSDDVFALKYGDLGPVYGKQWVDWGGYYEEVEKTRAYNNKTNSDTSVVEHLGWQKLYFKGINQIDNLINDILEEPDSRRHIVSAWNVTDIENMMLPPCHLLYQFHTIEMTKDERDKLNINNDENFPTRALSLQLYIRSQDVYLGQPFNIAAYSLLLHMVAQIVNMIPDEFILTIGDAHLYTNSFDAAEEICKRESYELPTLKLNKNVNNIYNFRYEDFEIENYNSHPNIKVDVAV